MFVGHLALIAAAIFTGAAFYVNFAEQPARLSLDDRSLLAQWKPAYKRGFSMQATLAIVGFLLGVLSWWLAGRLTYADLCSRCASNRLTQRRARRAIRRDMLADLARLPEKPMSSRAVLNQLNFGGPASPLGIEALAQIASAISLQTTTVPRIEM